MIRHSTIRASGVTEALPRRESALKNRVPACGWAYRVRSRSSLRSFYRIAGSPGRKVGHAARAALLPKQAKGRGNLGTPLREPEPKLLNSVQLDWESGYRSQPGEYSCELDEIDGAIPETLLGTLFRNGPGLFERGGHRYAHTLDGDGYVVKFAFAPGGRVHFCSRYVQTREMQAEERANAVLFRNAFGTQRPGGPLRNAFDMRLKNPANTNAVLWGGRLLALWEAGAPYELDPHDLHTMEGGEPQTLNGWIEAGIAPTSTGIPVLDRVMSYGDACTAHPHVLLASREGDCDRLVIWTWHSVLTATGGARVRMEVVEFDEAWTQLGCRVVHMDDGLINCHDFAISASSYVFFQSSTRFDLASYLLGLRSMAQCVEVKADPTKIYLAGRSGDAVQVTKTEPCFMLHHANAHDEGEETVVLSSGWGPAQMQALQRGSGMIRNLKLVHYGDFSALPYTALWRHRINRTTGEVAMEALYDGLSLDFPCVNPQVYSRKARFVFFTAAGAAEHVSAPLQAFARLDMETGDLQMWHAGPRSFCGELVFVPIEDAVGGEDRGHLLGLVYDADSQRSSLVVMDAADFSKGPVARIWLKHHIPHGLHGTFSSTCY